MVKNIPTQNIGEYEKYIVKNIPLILCEKYLVKHIPTQNIGDLKKEIIDNKYSY